MPIHRVCEQDAFFAAPPGLDRIHIFLDEEVLLSITIEFECQSALLKVECDFVL